MYLDDHRDLIELLENLCSIGFAAPGGALGAGALTSSSAALSLGAGMGRKKSGGMGAASCTNLADLA